MAFQSTHRKPSYRPDIDGLRAIAVLSVLFYHAGIPGFPGGFVGVDIFFVISGFLITGIVWSELQEGSFSLRDFYIRRMKRIFPALFALLLLSSIAATVLLIPRDLAKFGETVKATVLFYSNFYWYNHTDYFDAPAIDNPLLHTWSLAVEEQFYAFWPLILALLSRRVSIKVVIYVTFGLSLISLTYAEAMLPDYPREAFFYPWGRIWELLTGAALAVSPAALPRGKLATVLAATGLAAIALAVSVYNPSSVFPGLRALLPCGGAALIIAAGSPSNPLSRVLAAEPVRRIGLISYSLYLIHWPLFSFARLYVTEELSLALRLGLVTASVCAAYASWRWIETPLRRAPLPRLRVAGAAAAAMSCLLIAGISFSVSQGFPSRIGSNVLSIQPEGRAIFSYCRDLKMFKATRSQACELGEDKGGAYDFVLWGDSHARHFAPAISELAYARKLSGVMFARAGCHPFLEDPHTDTGCREFNATVSRWAQHRPLKLAILAGRWLTQGRRLRAYAEDDSAADNSGGLAKTLDFLTRKGMIVSVLDQVPEFPVEVGSCVSRAQYFGRDFRACATQPAALYESRHQVLNDYFLFLHKSYSFSLASANELICNSQECRAYDGETLLMRDSQHLAEPGALRAIPYLKIPLLTAPGSEQSAAATETEPHMAATGTPPL